MAGLPDFIFSSRVPVDVAATGIEREQYNASATFFEEVSGDYVPIAGLRSLACMIYPMTARDVVKTFDNARGYTDKVKLQEYNPNIHSGLVVRVTRPGGQQLDYDVMDAESDGAPRTTTALCKVRQSE